MKKKFVIEVEDDGKTTENLILTLSTKLSHGLWNSLWNMTVLNIKEVETVPLSSLETYPGKYESQSGNFYFSCDTGKSVLVGVKDETSTCPILGIVKICGYEMYECTEHAIALSDLENLAAANMGWEDAWEGIGVGNVTIDQWNETVGHIFGMKEPFWNMEDLHDQEVNHKYPQQVHLLFGEGGIYELHNGFE